MQIWKESNFTFHVGLKKRNFMLLKIYDYLTSLIPFFF